MNAATSWQSLPTNRIGSRPRQKKTGECIPRPYVIATVSARLLAVLVEPFHEHSMPEHAILRRQYPVPFGREIKKA